MKASSAHSFIADCILNLDQLEETFYHEWSHRDPMEWMHRKQEGKWSAAENVMHLVRINESYFPIFDALIEGNYKLNKFPLSRWLSKLSGRMILRSVSRDRSIKRKTLPIWEPQNLHEAAGIFDAYRKNHEELKFRLPNLIPALVAGARIASPANEYIQYALEDALRILIEHEWRHYAQALGAFS